MTIIFIIVAFMTGIITGISLIGILASGKSTDMWIAIERAAYKGDNTLCKELLEMKVDNDLPNIRRKRK